mgnify:CR=1 FL=1
MHIGRIFLFLCIFLTPLHVIAARGGGLADRRI